MSTFSRHPFSIYWWKLKMRVVRRKDYGLLLDQTFFISTFLSQGINQKKSHVLSSPNTIFAGRIYHRLWRDVVQILQNKEIMAKIPQNIGNWKEGSTTLNSNEVSSIQTKLKWSHSTQSAMVSPRSRNTSFIEYK